MKFFILGDSWGVGEWEVKQGLYHSVPNTGLDWWLTQQNHAVTNISAGSAGNFGQLRHAYWTLNDDADYDYIIWFHTESMRDIEEIIINDPADAAIQFPDFDIKDFDAAIEYITYRNYQYAQTISDTYRIPFIVIGGQSPVSASIQKFTFAQHVIVNWLAELLEVDTTPVNTFFSFEKIQRVLKHFNISERKYITDHLDALDQVSLLEERAKHSIRFPDNRHPSSACYQELANRIISQC